MRRATGADLRASLLAAAAWMERQSAAINALNVFPVPDGDTGTNMALTMRAAVKDLADVATVADGAGDVAARIEYGALMGARGNSGVILSQLLRGFSRSLQGQVDFDGVMLAEAFQAGAAMAYRAVIKPVEGTMLTVAREAAEAAVVAAQRRNDLTYVVGETLTAARASLERTPELLEILRQAGVVDAGGMGVVALLEGIHRYQTGATTESIVEAVAAASPGIDLAAVHADHPDDYGYCTNFMIKGEGMPYEAIRAHLAAAGQSVVVVGDERLIKVHLHTPDPGAALSYAGEHGALTQIKIDNMDEQRAAFEASQPGASAGPAIDMSAPVAVLAVAAGDGFARIFSSLGVSRVIARRPDDEPERGRHPGGDRGGAAAGRHRAAEQRQHRHGRPAGGRTHDQAGRGRSESEPASRLGGADVISRRRRPAREHDGDDAGDDRRANGRGDARRPLGDARRDAGAGRRGDRPARRPPDRLVG